MTNYLQESVERITGVLQTYALPRHIANERARNIVQALLDSVTKLEAVVHLLETKPGLQPGIGNFDKRVAAAKECYATHIACTNNSYWSKLVWLMEACGMADTEASEYLHRFQTENLPLGVDETQSTTALTSGKIRQG